MLKVAKLSSLIIKLEKYLYWSESRENPVDIMIIVSLNIDSEIKEKD